MKFLDLFAGIGGFRFGMEMAGHECAGHVEIDKFARQSYEAIHRPKKEEFNGTDITKITDDEWRSLSGTVDIICGGFPCQAFSTAGKRQGFEDTRGTLFFEIARAAKQIKPRLLLLENVKGLLSHDKGQTFAVILSTLDELGYDAEWQVLNSKNFGVPQNRERVFIVGHLRGCGGRQVFPFKRSDSEANAEQEATVNTVVARYGNAISVGSYIGEIQSQNVIQLPRGKNKGGLHEISPTVTSNSFQDNNFAIQFRNTCGYQIRRFTPRECWRLQGFPDWAFDRAKGAEVSDSQLYKQAGNSVTVNVIYEIAKKLKGG